MASAEISIAGTKDECLQQVKDQVKEKQTREWLSGLIKAAPGTNLSMSGNVSLPNGRFGSMSISGSFWTS